MPRKYPEKQRAYNRSHYSRNVQYYVDKSRKRTETIVAFMREQKRKPCTDCGYTFHPCAMDFDHVRGEKKLCVASFARRSALKALIEEIAKCDVVCANCHRIRTFNRIQRERSSEGTEHNTPNVEVAGSIPAALTII